MLFTERKMKASLSMRMPNSVDSAFVMQVKGK